MTKFEMNMTEFHFHHISITAFRYIVLPVQGVATPPPSNPELQLHEYESTVSVHVPPTPQIPAVSVHSSTLNIE